MTLALPRRSFVLLAGLGGLATLTARTAPATVPRSDGIAFRVEHGGREVGWHRVGFRREDGATVVDTEIEVRVRFGPVTVYRYDHQSRETWRDGRLIGLQARTDKNGATQRFEARAADGELRVDGDAGRFVLPAATLPTNYWVKVTAAREVWLGSQTGQPVRFAVQPRGTEPVPAADGGTLAAERYTLSGDLESDVWYRGDAWVGLRFTGPDGSAVTYRPLQAP